MSEHALLTISKAGALSHWICCFPVFKSLSALPNRPFDDVLKSFSENISVEGDGKPSAAVSTLEATCYGEMFCLLSLYLSCVSSATQREILQIDRKHCTPQRSWAKAVP